MFSPYRQWSFRIILLKETKFKRSRNLLHISVKDFFLNLECMKGSFQRLGGYLMGKTYNFRIKINGYIILFSNLKYHV